MRVSHYLVILACKQRSVKLKDALRAAGVSSNAYYSLARKASAVPRSISRLAEVLGVPVSKLMIDEEAMLEEQLRLLAEVDRIALTDSTLDRDTIRHTLVLLDEPPLNRLRRALRLGRIGCSD